MTNHEAETDAMARGMTSELFTAIVNATTDDWAGHLPNCGYTDEEQTCGCSEWGARLAKAIAPFVPTDPPSDVEPGGESETVTEWGVRGVLPEPDPATVWQYPSETPARLTARHERYGGTVVSRQRTTHLTAWVPADSDPITPPVVSD